QGDRRDDTEKFEPQLHSCPTRPIRAEPVLSPYRILTTSIGAGTLRVRLPLPPRWNLFCLPRFPCCARSIHPRVPAARGLSSARSPCPRPLSSPNNRAYLPPTLAQTRFPPALQLPAPPGNTSPWNPHCPP